MPLRRLAPLALSAALLTPAAPVLAQSVIPASCPTSKTLTRLNVPLTRTAAALRAGGKVVIVAIGSSSTAGAGASSPQATYPSRLEATLRARFPAADISVVNRGVNGQDAPEMLARFDTDVAALKPTLVIWQSGVNALFRDNGLASADDLLHEAIARVKAIGADLVLVDPQYAPRVLADADSGPMVRLMNEVGAEEGVAVYHRFALMRDWHETASMGFDSFLWKDKFHMNDWGYDCFARDLGRAVVANVESQQRSADMSVGGGSGAAPAGATRATPAVAGAAR
ncbi:SGNH/GDSL hydrolase family protein [Ancylobacter sp. IITR112]|uniref:SGNH/GDSL hydrolase family protein n=1 Tax=Ancylobacter sp. IITR112 TaxID=3138073 RepID=UPI00352B03C5